MIRREIRAHPDETLEVFDYFNDYKDTRNWLEYFTDDTSKVIMHRLDEGHKEWLKCHQSV